MPYLHWNKQTITDFSEDNITALYNEGYVFTREDKGSMDQTRSLRIDLSQFKLTSENRRILRKAQGLTLKTTTLPNQDYHWSIGKLAKDFYDTKFGQGTFSANKVKQLLTSENSNFNIILEYKIRNLELEISNFPIAYAICYQNSNILHYSYPFYALGPMPYASLGMSMMLQAITYAKEEGKQYIYLGSAQRPTDTYKFQFKGLEWFDGKTWRNDFDELKTILSS